jgi:hypothetical protein
MMSFVLCVTLPNVLSEPDKILQVKSAEVEAEAKYLSGVGVGVAKQRKAIVDGLQMSIVDFT